MQEQILRAIEKSSQSARDELREMVRLYPAGAERLQETIAEKFEALGCERATTVQHSREFAIQEAIDISLRTHARACTH
jgi:hypothetical protein